LRNVKKKNLLFFRSMETTSADVSGGKNAVKRGDKGPRIRGVERNALQLKLALKNQTLGPLNP
jgi:hypothetical protein